MFKTLKEMVIVFHMVVPGISDQDKGHKITHFVYNSNNVRGYFWTQALWAASNAAWLEGENYWTEQNVCWNILTEKIPGSLGDVSLGTRPENQKHTWKVQQLVSLKYTQSA